MPPTTVTAALLPGAVCGLAWTDGVSGYQPSKFNTDDPRFALQNCDQVFSAVVKYEDSLDI